MVFNYQPTYVGLHLHTQVLGMHTQIGTYVHMN